MNKPVYLVCAKRTAIGTLMGSLSSISGPKLGAAIIENIIKETKIDPSIIDEVIMGQVICGGSGQNPARIAQLSAHLPYNIPSTTINKVCGSGLKSVMLAAQSILAGDSNLIIAGGQESMSQGLHGVYLRPGNKFGDSKLIDLTLYDGLTDAFSNKPMGVTGENIAKLYGITRTQQDEWALRSHQKAAKAQQEGIFNKEILPVTIVSKKQQDIKIFQQDEGIRSDTSAEKLARLKPVFLEGGSVTAGNSSSVNDGAAALLIASEEALEQYKLEPIAKIVSYASTGVDPNIMGIGPISASQSALKKAKWKIDDLDVIELNEAFAVQTICVNNAMKWDLEKVNIAGGAIALGHPIGASGARCLVTLIHHLKRLNAKHGLVTLCIGGGMGVAMCLENM